MTSTPTLAPAEEQLADAKRKVSISAILDNPRLPSPPAVVLQIVEKASRPDCDPDKIVALLSQDSGLCCQVLKTVNSGIYGLSRPVGSLKHAVRLLGVRPLRSLVLSLALPAFGLPEKDELILKYWQESVAGAVIAREIAVILHRPDPEDDLVAGLLRDLGVLVLREAFGQDYRALWLRSPKEWAQRQCAEEKENFGVDHTEVSAGLLNTWNLPIEVYQPIRYHHNPEACAAEPKEIQDRAWLLYFASKVATLDSNSSRPVSELLQIAQTRLAMDQGGLIKFLTKVMPAIREFASLLKVDIGNIPNYSAIIATGCQELVKLSVETSRTPMPAAAPSHNTPRQGGPVTPNTPGRLERRSRDDSAVADPSGMPDFDVSCLDRVGPAGFRLNGYEIKEIFGRGGMGVVFKAYDPMLNRFAALKMMTPHNLVQSDARERFKREARAVAAIQHESVVTIYFVSEVNGLPYLVMEYLPGTTLQDRVDKEGRLPLVDVIPYGRQIAAGLHAAHERHVIHRDIKPANILLGRDPGTIKITDFGLARVTDDVRVSQDGTVVGTPLFMAPEQFTGLGVDHRADLFSLGGLLYTLITGKTPFQGNSVMAVMRQVCNGSAPSLRLARPETPLWLSNLINKLLSKLPAARHQSAAEVIQVIDKEFHK